MPTLLLKTTATLTAPERRALAQALTGLSTRLLGKRAEVTAVLIESWPADHWYIGGEAPAQPTALLDISITQGTNRPEEKADFIAAAFAQLAQHLGGALAPASYVQVHELPAGDWGYGGITQQARKQQAAAL